MSNGKVADPMKLENPAVKEVGVYSSELLLVLLFVVVGV